MSEVPPLRVLTSADLRRLVPMADAIDLVGQAYVHLSARQAVVPKRLSVAVTEQDAVALYMPAAVPPVHALGAKAVSVFPRNRQRGLPTIMAVVLIQDAATGAPVGLVEGASLTALRTGASSGLATRLLARPDAGIVALFGSGVQARTQLEAVFSVRPVTQVRVMGRDPGRTEAFVVWARQQPWIARATVLAAASPALAVRGADLVITATSSPSPVVPTSEVARGAHLNAIGAFTPTTREVEGALVGLAKVVVDSREAALAEAGDIILAIEQGYFAPERIHAEIGEVAAGLRSGRAQADEITLFKSVGTAVLDVVVGAEALQRAGPRDGVVVYLAGEGVRAGELRKGQAGRTS